MVSSKVVSKAKSSILNPQYLRMPFSPLTELKFVSAATTPSNPLVGSGIESLFTIGMFETLYPLVVTHSSLKGAIFRDLPNYFFL